MKQLMGASIVGESGREVLYWSGGFGFLLCEEVEPGFWKVETLAREEGASLVRGQVDPCGVQRHIRSSVERFTRNIEDAAILRRPFSCLFPVPNFQTLSDQRLPER